MVGKPRSIRLVVSAVVTLLLCAVSIHADESKVVDNVMDLVSVIGSNTLIFLLPGTYNLSEAAGVINPNATWTKAESVDQLVLKDLQHLELRAVNGRAAICVDPAAATVLSFVRCKGVTLSGIDFRHSGKGGTAYSGDVLAFTDCGQVSMDDCLLTEGAQGVALKRVEQLSFAQAKIRKCTRKIASISSCNGIEFNNAEMLDNSGDFLLDIQDSRDVIFLDTYIIGNYAADARRPSALFRIDAASTVSLKNTTIANNDVFVYAADSAKPETIGCTLRGNKEPKAPVISDLTVGEITENSAMVTWKTDIEARSQVEYGPTGGQALANPWTDVYSTSHRITLKNLTPGTDYQVNASSISRDGLKTTPVKATFSTHRIIHMNAGDYVEFGSYLGARILWRVMEINDGRPLLWSEYILCAKCFDAAESGTADKGSSDSAKYGSNVWGKSNLREWLNSVGKVKWTTQPPTKKAIYGDNNYENEDGFLTGFSETERDQMIETERRITDDRGSYKETTQDTIFLASYDEVENGGKWRLNTASRIKSPTSQAVNQDRNTMLKLGSDWWYYLETPSADNLPVVGSVDFVGIINWFGAYGSDIGVAPALHLSNINMISGNGTRENPWRY